MISKGRSSINLPNSPFASKEIPTRPVLQPAPSNSTPLQPAIMYHPSQQMSGPQSPPIQPGPPGGMQQHHYPPPPGSEPQEAQPSSQYPQYSYDIQLKYPPPHPQQENQPPHPNQQYNPAQGLPLPSMSTNGLPPGALPPPNGYAPMPPREQMDTTGQIAPPGMKPRVTATLWEDEGTLCFQVDVKGTCVARREGKITPPLFLSAFHSLNPPPQFTFHLTPLPTSI